MDQAGCNIHESITAERVELLDERGQAMPGMETVMNNCKAFGVFLGLSALALMVVDACASSSEQGVGQMLIDAGVALGGHGGARTLIDAGTSLVDAGRMHNVGALAQALPEAASGTRIQLRRSTQIGSDGARSAPGFTYYDTALNVACTLAPMSDGTTRCVPQSSASVSRGYFAGSLCVDPVVMVAPCQREEYALESVPATSCAPMSAYTRVYSVGPALTGPAYTMTSAGDCVKTTPPATTVLLSVGAESQPSQFVQFTETIDAL